MSAAVGSTRAFSPSRDKSSDAVIKAVGVNHSYEGQNGWVHALEDFEITIRKNEFLCIQFAKAEAPVRQIA